MSSQKVINYIKEQLEAGHSKEEIKKALSKANWNEKEIENFFNSLNKNKKDPPQNNKTIFIVLILFLLFSSLGFGGFYFLNQIETTDHLDFEERIIESDYLEEEDGDIDEEKKGEIEDQKEEGETEEEVEDRKDDEKKEVGKKVDKEEEEFKEEDKKEEEKEDEIKEDIEDEKVIETKEEIEMCSPGQFEVDFKLGEDFFGASFVGEMTYRGLENGYCHISYSLDVPEEKRASLDRAVRENSIFESVDYFFASYFLEGEKFLFLPERYFEEFDRSVREGLIEEYDLARYFFQSFHTEEEFLNFAKIIDDYSRGDYYGKFEWTVVNLFLLKYSYIEEIELMGSLGENRCGYKKRKSFHELLEELPGGFPEEEFDGDELVFALPFYCLIGCDQMIDSLLDKRSTKSADISVTTVTPEGLDYYELVEIEDRVYQEYSYSIRIVDDTVCTYPSDEDLIERDPNIVTERDIFKALSNHEKAVFE